MPMKNFATKTRRHYIPQMFVLAQLPHFVSWCLCGKKRIFVKKSVPRVNYDFTSIGKKMITEKTPAAVECFRSLSFP